MIDVTVTVNPADIERFSQVMAKIHNTLSVPMKNLVQQAMKNALRGAAKNTKSGTARNYTVMEDKYKYRPIVEMDRAVDGWFWYITASGKVFRNTNLFGERAMRQGINRIISFYEAWNKEKNHWYWIPYMGSGRVKGFNKSSRVGKIPCAGAGKVGWYGALDKLGESEGSTGDNRKPLSTVQQSYTALEAGIAVTNLVDYVGKTSPESAAIGLRNAEQIMIHKFQKQMDLIGAY
jgi:hypothetical protein